MFVCAYSRAHTKPRHPEKDHDDVPKKKGPWQGRAERFHLGIEWRRLNGVFLIGSIFTVRRLRRGR